MSTLTLTNVSTGASILATDLNNGWAALRSVVNGNIDEANFTSGQLYSPAKIRQDGAATNDVLAWTGSAWDNSPLTTIGRGNLAIVYGRVSSTVDVTNTTAETDLVSQLITGGHMGTNRSLRLTMLGDVFATSITTMTMRLKFGGTAIWGDVMNLSSTTGAQRTPWMFQATVANLGVATTQFTVAQLTAASPNLGSVAGVGNESGSTIPWITAGESSRLFGDDLAAATDANTASDQTLAFSVQAGTAAATWSVRRHYWTLELV